MMQKSKIEWTDYTLNSVKGKCPMACDYCYARRLYDRFKWDPTIRFEPEVMADLAKMPDGSKVFWGSTIELFHKSIPEEWLKFMFYNAKLFDNLIHIFLTKCPENLPQWSPFPDNCWVGVSATDHHQYLAGLRSLRDIDAPVRFFSFEPLLHRIDVSYDVLDWVIIGAQTPYSVKTAPRLEWVSEIIDATDEAGVPVFLKDNLTPVVVQGASPEVRYFEQFGGRKCPPLRQEFPVKKHPEKQGVVY